MQAMNLNELLLDEMMTIRFIQLYHENKLLWDRSHPLHRNEAERQRCYGRIVDGMAVPGFDVSAVVATIDNIEHVYLREALELEETGNKSNIFWFPIVNSMIGQHTGNWRLDSYSSDDEETDDASETEDSPRDPRWFASQELANRIANFLRHLPPHYALLAQREIQDCLVKYRLMWLDHRTILEARRLRGLQGITTGPVVVNGSNSF